MFPSPAELFVVSLLDCRVETEPTETIRQRLERHAAELALKNQLADLRAQLAEIERRITALEAAR